MLEFFLFFMMIVLLIGLINIPIMIANSRGICGGEKITITILSWLGVFFGVTWVIALILSLLWRGECAVGATNLDKLEQVARLYRTKAITKSEYEKMKSKLLKNE